MKIILKQLKQLFRLIGHSRGRWPIYLIGMLGVASQSLLMNYVMSRSLDGLTDAALQKDTGILIGTLLELTAGLLILTLLIPFFTYAFESAVKRITGNLRKDLFRHIQRLPMSEVESSHSGDMLSRLTNDIQTAENAYGWQLALLLMSVVSGIGSVIIILTVNIWLAVSAVGIGLLLFLGNTVFVKPLQKISDRVQSSLSDANQKLSDAIAGNMVAKIYNLAKTLTRKYMEANLGIRKGSMKRTVYMSALNSINWFLGMMSFIGMIIIGSIMCVNGDLEVGSLMFVVQMMNGIGWMFSAIGSYITQLQGSMAGSARVFEILDAPLEPGAYPKSDTPDVSGTWKADLTAWADGSPVLQFDSVDFAYNGDDLVLNGFTTEVHKGETSAVVGLSGSGKSTLFKLLLGFYMPAAGRIRLFGRDLREFTLSELRGLIAYVPQESYLFSGTIRDNIAYGRLDASAEDIVEAAKAAFAHDFIMELPEGYETQVGERGARLSGGQRQRIAIARALLKNAPVLLLDEATASLDSESEQQVQKALEVLMKGRTTIAVAHRLSTIRNAKSILVMESGSVVEEGNHDSLLSLDGSYAKLYNLQFQNLDSAPITA